MTIANFQQMIEKVKEIETKRIAVAVAEDEDVLLAIRQAQDEGLTDAILTGDEDSIRKIAKEHNISLDGIEIIHEPDPSKAALKCCHLIREGKASVMMKGLLDTSLFMRAALNKEKGLNSGNLISHVATFELSSYHKLLFVTDAAINIAPSLKDKVGIINNAAWVAQRVGIEEPLVAVCTAVEKVKAEAMPATAEAAILAKMSDRGQIKGCIVDGPFALDNAIDEESARIKKIKSPVAGKADVVLCPNIEASNVLYKSLAFLAQGKAGAVVVGANAPLVLTSRADSHETKFLSIVLALLIS